MRPEASRHPEAVTKVGLASLQGKARPVPQGLKRYDFLASGGVLSDAEARFLKTSKRK